MSMPTRTKSSPWKYCMKCGSTLEDKLDVEQRIRRACSNDSCAWIFYDNPVPVVAGVVEHFNTREEAQDGKSEPHVILVQGRGWPSRLYGLVTGFLEQAECPREGILREVREELGLEDAELVDELGSFGGRDVKWNQVILAYHVRAYGPIVMDPRELQAYKRIPSSKVRAWPFATGLALEEYLRRRSLIQGGHKLSPNPSIASTRLLPLQPNPSVSSSSSPSVSSEATENSSASTSPSPSLPSKL